MPLKRLHIGLTIAQMKQLERLALKLGLDKTSTIRYCVARVSELEGTRVKKNTATDHYFSTGEQS